MTANVSKKNETLKTLNNINPVQGIMEVLDQLEENAEMYRLRFPRNYNASKGYISIMQSINTLYSVLDGMKYMRNHELLRQIGSDMEAVQELDPEIKGFIINIDPSPNHHHNIAHLEYNTPKNAPAPSLFDINGNSQKIRESLSNTTISPRERKIYSN